MPWTPPLFIANSPILSKPWKATEKAALKSLVSYWELHAEGNTVINETKISLVIGKQESDFAPTFQFNSGLCDVFGKLGNDFWLILFWIGFDEHLIKGWSPEQYKHLWW